MSEIKYLDYSKNSNHFSDQIYFERLFTVTILGDGNC